MDQIMESLRSWIDRLEEKNRVAVTYIGFFIIGVLLVAAGLVINVEVLQKGLGDFGEPLQVILGSLGGALWFLSLYILWYKVLPDDVSNRLNYRMNVPLMVRRRFTAGAVAIWFVALIFVYRNYVFLAPVIGALNVVVLLIVWRLITMNPIERFQSEQSFQEEQERELWLRENQPVIPTVDPNVQIQPDGNKVKTPLLKRLLKRQ